MGKKEGRGRSWHALQVIGQGREGALWGHGVGRRGVKVGGQQEVGGYRGWPAATAVLAQGREEGAGRRRRLLLHVGCRLILEPQWAAAGPTTGPALPPRAAANYADALHCLDALAFDGPVGVLERLDGCPLGAGRHQRLDAVVAAFVLLTANLLTFPLVLCRVARWATAIGLP